MQTLADAQKASAFALEAKNRQFGIQFAVVTDNQDPNGLQRIKTTGEGKGGLVSSDFCMRMQPCPYWDPPLPLVGTSVALANFDGDPHDVSAIGVMVNATNPPFPKKDPINDDWREIPGDATLKIAKRWDITTTEYTHHQTQLLMYDLFRLQLADGLPEASEENRGKMLVVKGEDCVSPDKAYICLKGRNKVYEWVEWASGNTTPCA